MATKKKATAAPAPEESIENALSKTEKFFEKNAKTLLTALIVVVVIVGGYFGFKYLYSMPRANKAADMMFVAEQQFAAEDYQLALDGDGNNAGFIEVVDKYASTPAGSLAAHYAGVCYMKLGQVDDALQYLTKYRKGKGAAAGIINAQNLGLQGDVYDAKSDYAKSVELYRKAVDVSDNDLTAPYYLAKLGGAYAKLGKIAEAVAAYKTITENYASSMEARDADKYIGQLEQK